MLYDFLKRSLDVCSALGIALLFAPLIILVCIGIKFDSPGPVIYKQRRVGINGKIFYIWKFRSMYHEAENFYAKDKQFLKGFKKKEGWKLEASQDPRITRVGRFIRRYTLDELPNLWNIFVGDMSIVGPRAYRNDAILGDEAEEQLKLYPDRPDLREKLKIAWSVKPGLTGPWQTSGRNKLSWDKRVELDAAYAQTKSIFGDIKYIFKTPFVMLNKW